MMLADDRFNGEFYLCPAYNYIDGTISNVSSTRMWGLGTPEDLKAAIADSDFVAEVDRIR
jgi:predicted heme/steroid binding protein